MSIQLVDRNEGLPPEEVAGRLSTGWLCVSNVAVSGASIALPGQPQTTGKTMDVWLAPAYGAMMPQAAVLQGLFIAEEKGGDLVTLNQLAQMWFQQSLRDLRKTIEMTGEQGGEPSPE